MDGEKLLVLRKYKYYRLKERFTATEGVRSAQPPQQRHFHSNQPQKFRISPRIVCKNKMQAAVRQTEKSKKSIIYIIVDILIDIVVEKVAVNVVSHLCSLLVLVGRFEVAFPL